MPDRAAFEPRFGMTWAPSAGGRTTVRGSAGVFHSWLPLQAIEQTLRLNGQLQREILITDPAVLRTAYPGEPAVLAERVLPTNKYSIGDFKLGRNIRYSAGIDQTISPRLRVNLLYNYIHLQQQPRGNNLNTPVDGVRPDPDFGNVIEAMTDGQIRRHDVVVNTIVNLAAQGPAASQPRFNWRRLTMNAGYTLVEARRNAAGFFDVPPTGDLDLEWGPGPEDSPYRIQLLLTSSQLRNLTVNATYLTNAGTPYNWTTGLDDNGDGLLNDRPAGVGPRSLRAPGHQWLNMRVAHAMTMGQAPQASTPARYRVNVFANITNLTNQQNLAGHSGVETSPFFRQPRIALNPRRVDFGVGVNF